MPAVLTTTEPPRLLTERYALRLYANDHWPTVRDTAAAYEEATFSGYRAAVLSRWVAVAGKDWLHPAALFQSDSHQREQYIWGYFVTGKGGLVFAERFNDGPYIMGCPGDRIILPIRVTFRR